MILTRNPSTVVASVRCCRLVHYRRLHCDTFLPTDVGSLPAMSSIVLNQQDSFYGTKLLIGTRFRRNGMVRACVCLWLNEPEVQKLLFDMQATTLDEEESKWRRWPWLWPIKCGQNGEVKNFMLAITILHGTAHELIKLHPGDNDFNDNDTWCHRFRKASLRDITSRPHLKRYFENACINLTHIGWR